MGRKGVDIAIVGAGPAGATAARLLALRGRQVLLIDPGQYMVDRLEILSPAAMDLLQGLQLAEILLDPAIARPCAGIRRRWISPHVEFDDFLCRPGGKGFVVSRAAFDARLSGLAQAAGSVVLAGRVLSVRQEPDCLQLEIGHGGDITRLSASLAIDATGRAAALACRLGAQRIVSERLVAERRSIDRCDLPSQDATWLEVEANSGFWAYTTLGPGGRREAWTVHRNDRRRSAQGELFNASAACLSPAAGRRWIAIGDAAAAFDPIASQGLVVFRHGRLTPL